MSTTDVENDRSSTNLFMVRWDGSERVQLTHTDGSESHPRFSPDGKTLGFLAARADSDDEDEDEDDPGSKSQVHLLNRSGGEARRLTALAGGVSSFEWSPDSRKLVIVSKDPQPSKIPDAANVAKTTPPIVIDRYQFKRDGEGYLGERYRRIYVFAVAAAEATLLTPGRFDSTEPAWSPDGRFIAFTSKREGDPDRHQNTDSSLSSQLREARRSSPPKSWTAASPSRGGPPTARA